MPNFEYESKIKGRVAGVDEAGRGPLAGPVVAAAVIINSKKIPSRIDDSKKLTAKVREEIFLEITSLCDFGIGICSVEEIDEINIFQATKRAMVKAVEGLKTRPEHVLVDGNHKPAFGIPTTAIVKGDALSLSIAAASIIAKVTRDRMMIELHETFPQYNWISNKGYATLCHRSAITEHGICGHHRRSFAPVRDKQRQMEMELA